MSFERRLPPHRVAQASPVGRAAQAAVAAISGLIGLGLCGSTQAQSLQDMYDAARVYDATFLGARAQAESAEYRAKQAYALRLPTVGLSGGISRNNADTPYTTPQTTNTDTSSVTVSAQQNLYNRANDISIEQADRSVTVAQAALVAAEQDLIVRLAQAYFDVLGAEDNLGTVQASKKAISEQLASAKRNFEVGTATITDTREAQARYDLALAQELAADNDLLVKHLALEQLVGRNALKPSPLALPVQLPALAPSAVDDWLAAAEQYNTSIIQTRLGLDVAKLETDKARAGHLPTVALAGSYSKSRLYVSGESSGTGYSVSGNGSNAAIGVTVTVPLFAGFAVQNRVKETLALEEKSRNDLDFARRSVAQGTRSAFFGVQSGRAQVLALEAA